MKKLLTVFMACLLTACSTKIQTRYYNLQVLPDSPTSIQLPTALPANTTLGIGPVKLPSMLNRKGIVTQKSGSAVQIASHDIWAGRLDEDFPRVIAELMAKSLGINEVVTKPWNTRFRPQYQLQLDVQHFSGQLGGQVRFKVNWILSGNYGRKKLLSRTEDITLQTSGDDYPAYVSTLNALLAAFTEKSARIEIANEIKKHAKERL